MDFTFTEAQQTNFQKRTSERIKQRRKTIGHHALPILLVNRADILLDKDLGICRIDDDAPPVAVVHETHAETFVPRHDFFDRATKPFDAQARSNRDRPPHDPRLVESLGNLPLF